MCEPNADIDLQTTDVEASKKIQENVDNEVGTFTGDDLSWKPTDGSHVADIMVVDDKVVVVKSEDVDFGDDEVKVKEFEKVVDTDPQIWSWWFDT